MNDKFSLLFHIFIVIALISLLLSPTLLNKIENKEKGIVVIYIFPFFVAIYNNEKLARLLVILTIITLVLLIIYVIKSN